MQFGEAVSQSEAERLLDVAWDEGIDFFDSAEMYPVPQRKDTQGYSERILGYWLRRRQRDLCKVATKATGPSGQMSYIRDGPVSLSGADIKKALEGSLLRLQTDHIDLYLLHWPDRYVPMFGETEYNPQHSYPFTPFEDQYEALDAACTEGKIGAFGLSNETAWGLMQFCELARGKQGSPVVALQNAYSLLCRNFDSSLAECCHQEGVGLMAYSPLAMGLLTGKYLDPDNLPQEARLVKYRGRYAEAESRYGSKPNLSEAVRAYCDLAQQAGIPPYELALRPLVMTTVIGVTNPSQLRDLIQAARKGPLDKDLLLAIDAVHQRYPNPTP